MTHESRLTGGHHSILFAVLGEDLFASGQPQFCVPFLPRKKISVKIRLLNQDPLNKQRNRDSSGSGLQLDLRT